MLLTLAGAGRDQNAGGRRFSMTGSLGLRPWDQFLLWELTSINPKRAMWSIRWHTWRFEEARKWIMHTKAGERGMQGREKAIFPGPGVHFDLCGRDSLGFPGSGRCHP